MEVKELYMPSADYPYLTQCLSCCYCLCLWYDAFLFLPNEKLVVVHCIRKLYSVHELCPCIGIIIEFESNHFKHALLDLDGLPRVDIIVLVKVKQGFFQKICQEGAKPGFGEIWGGKVESNNIP